LGISVVVAALYDVEGNLPALEAVLAELEGIGPDAIVFGGDLFCGAQPVEVIDLARSLANAQFLLGNADRLDEPNVAYMGTPDDSLLEMVSGIEQWTIVVGHTHMQFDRRVGGYRMSTPVRSVPPGSAHRPPTGP
jgi:hypothetical protein